MTKNSSSCFHQNITFQIHISKGTKALILVSLHRGMCSLWGTKLALQRGGGGLLTGFRGPSYSLTGLGHRLAAFICF